MPDYLCPPSKQHGDEGEFKESPRKSGRNEPFPKTGQYVCFNMALKAKALKPLPRRVMYDVVQRFQKATAPCL